MDLKGLLFLVFLWFVFGILGQAKKKAGKGPRRPSVPRRTPSKRVPIRSESVRQGSTQVEGGRLQEWLRQLEQTLQEGQQAPDRQVGRGPDVALPEAEDVEERETLGGERDWEEREFPDRSAPHIVDLDEEAEKTANRRLAEANVRNRAMTLADHKAFDRRIRATQAVEVVEPVVGPSAKVRRLRDAVVWAEILKTPKGLE